jgi:superfamily II DNA or RNA helicase
MQIELRPYQRETIERVLARYEQTPTGAAKFVWATGLGKTLGFSAIAHEIRKLTNTNVLIIAHREELLNQAITKYRYIDPDAHIGKVGGGCYEWGAPITVATIQTLARSQHLKNLKHFHFGLGIVDEAHHALADNDYGKVMAVLPHAFWVGCTATDDRLDRRSNADLFGESIYTMSILAGIEQGYLTSVRAIAIQTGTSLDGLHTHDGDYRTQELADRIDTPERNARIVNAYLTHGPDRQAMGFCVDVPHAYHLAQSFNERGVKAVAVHGDTPKAEREQILADFESGIYQVLTNCQLFTEGYDATTVYDTDTDRYVFLSCAIMARPTRSRALFGQCIGRILRLAPTKTDALILDATDNVLNHRLDPQSLSSVIGLPLRDGESVLEGLRRKHRSEQDDEREERVRTAPVRTQEYAIDVSSRLDWQKQRGGHFVLEVGPQKHQIRLEPSPETTGYYTVWAQLAPDFTRQQWETELPLDLAQQQAERRAKLLLANEKKNLALVDRNAAWRSWPMSFKQMHTLRRLGIPFTATTTRGEASDLLSKAFAEKEKEQAAKQAKGTTRRTKKRAQVSA